MPFMEPLERRQMLASTASLGYSVQNLVSDGLTAADNTDTALQNPIGLASGDGQALLVANNHTASATFYNGDGSPVNDGGGDETPDNPHQFAVPPSSRTAGPGLPSGAVFNSSSKGFLVAGAGSGSAEYFLSSGDGVISAYDPGTDPNNSVVVVDRNRAGSAYTGLTQATYHGTTYLYAADFANGKVDVYNGNYKLSFFEGYQAGDFKDRGIPKGYEPFGIQAAGGMIFVTYALRDPATGKLVTGAHRGYVDEYTPGGGLYRRVASRGTLNAPWGLALAPSHFGKFSNNLLVGNHGDGRITAYSFFSDHTTYHGLVPNSVGGALTVDGLWALRFGNGSVGQDANTLFFTAGPNADANGVFGEITANTP